MSPFPSPCYRDFSSLSKDNAYHNNKLVSHFHLCSAHEPNSTSLNSVFRIYFLSLTQKAIFAVTYLHSLFDFPGVQAFEVAETKLGIPALLDPKDMVSCEVPDCLSIITYLSQYYSFFNSNTGPASLRSSHMTLLNNFTRIKSPDGLKPLKSWTHLETSKDQLSNTKPQTLCKLCSKPVHLIQRHLVDGEVYHRSCFRCKVCRCTLLPEFYTQGSDAGSLICTYHTTDSKSTRADFSQQIGSADYQPKSMFQTGYVSLSGLVVTGVPHYTMKTESQDKLVCETAKTEVTGRQERSREVKDRETSSDGLKSMVKKPAPLTLPPPSGKGRTVEVAEQAGPVPTVADSRIKQEAPESQQPSEHSSLRVRVAEGSGRPVPAPRRMLTNDSSSAPVPTPRVKTSQTTSSSPAAGNATNRCKSPPISPHIISPTSRNPKVKTNHPWLGIIHPGPWTQLPPAPPPVTTPRFKSSLQGTWYRPRLPPPNPFAEVDEKTCEEAAKCEPAGETKSTVNVCHSESSDNLANNSGDTDVAGDAENTANKPENNAQPLDKPIPPKRQVGVSVNTVETPISSSVLEENRGTGGSLLDVTEPRGLQAASDAAQSHFLPRSVSVPAIISAHSQNPLERDGLTEADESVTCSQSKPCKENPYDGKSAMPKSKTFQALTSQRAPAPGHGFPLIKRKVQTDQTISTGDLQVELGELNKQLEALEQRGVELERNLRECRNDKAEQMLMEWFSLVHERHVLVRRDAELVYLRKQQKLEEKQADVEYNLRCLLNKPESDWSQVDLNREQQLLNELVAIIEQRNQIISSLDQDRQREREEDVVWEAMMTNKELQKEGLKELKKSKGKLKPSKVFKMLSHKAEGTKNSVDKKS
ncbi:MICAL-like protein 1 isoform X2 [Anabas testudineus]|uniref:MICAL-like protein 1 isoform X2 n=1 Tax=Anabas testudineus TaxID=64144 RepID=UPI000E460CD2|nr:MICAL-like protein 1 isoform X2 [Anabas testudineus]